MNTPKTKDELSRIENIFIERDGDSPEAARENALQLQDDVFSMMDDDDDCDYDDIADELAMYGLEMDYFEDLLF